MKKPTVVIIKSSPWKSAHLSRSHPEYAAIFSLIHNYRREVRFVLVGTSASPSRAYIIDNDILALDIERGTSISHITYQLELIRLHFKYKPNLTIVLGMQLLPSAIFSLVSKKFRYVPIFIGEFGYYGYKIYGRILNSLYLKANSIFLKLSRRHILRLFALSNYVRDELCKSVPDLEGRIQLVSYPISPSFDSNVQKEYVPEVSETTVILTIAGIEPRKGLDTLIEAVSLLERKPKVIIKGSVRDPTYARRLRKMVKCFKLERYVSFLTETIDYDELVDLYKSATLFVFPTREDCLGVVVLEALHSNLPVIATSVGGIPDMIEEGLNGLLVKPADPKGLSKAIKLLLENKPLRQTFQKNARKVLIERYYNNRITLGESLDQSVKALLAEK